jgi:asparagine synthase (glutamine-hydrolysing)
MCGIVGILSARHHRDEMGPICSRDRILRMMEAVRHRGPDEAGLLLGETIALGHTRLSIVDLAGGSQPIANEDATIQLVFNGEIFNHVELRAQLERKGHRFATDSDTETIVHLYEEHGRACVEYLNGQFAFALWDAPRGRLLLARDRLGIRPLHYAYRDGTLLFGSEVKSLFASGLLPARIDRAAIGEIATFWTNLPGRTAFEHVSEIPPGHLISVRPGQVASPQRYWDLDFTPSSACQRMSVAAATDAVGELLHDAIRIRLRADVPVGAYLSGGLDSSGLAATVATDFNSSLRTFGIRFHEPRFDESDYQRRMVEHLGVAHSEVDVSNAAIVDSLPQVVAQTERPLLRTAPVPMFRLAASVRAANYKVVLTGEGADEFFGGYNIFRETKLRHFWSRQPASAWRPAPLRRLYPYLFDDPRQAGGLHAFFAAGLTEVDDPLYSHRIRWRNTARLVRLLSDDLSQSLSLETMLEPLRATLPDAFGSWTPVARAQYLETTTFMSQYLLSSQGDRMAMGNSVEIRLPFLDHRLVELMARMPDWLKIRGMQEKYLLKKIFAPRLPAAVVARSKQPFRAPISSCLLAPTAPDYVGSLLDSAQLKADGIFDPARVTRLIARLKCTRQPSEVDNMALALVLTTGLLAEETRTGSLGRGHMTPPRPWRRLKVSSI